MNPADLTELVGYGGALLTTLSFIPQAWRSWRTRDVSGISTPMYVIFTVGVALWLAYGWRLGAWPVVVANAVTLSLSIAILGMKLVFGKAARSTEAAGRQ